MVKDIRRLANLEVRLLDSEDGGMVVHEIATSSLCAEVKKKIDYVYQIWMIYGIESLTKVTLRARGTETTIDWPTRMRIAIGITKGICFLHTKENIIHGNLTSRNILLDEQNNPKIADVGLSRLMTTAGNTNVIATAGTLGYHAPELSKIKNASTKTDVYSLGVIILELLTGKSPSEAMDDLDLPQWVASIVKEEWTNEVFDVELMRDAPNIGGEFLNT
ncbi:probably inactive leucine-rich repeat receptor-like protein kinase IMK2 [Capsicum annuum]|uniref:probably inactive leucine-rich repeat receptor-like protein kinase IMK2 n=1 Tax=Capsicum annuum TaxID=4072 RepID=UPI001FB0FBF3|nr:probably inactive leucine-rich repeat receptor-like protein kinase IMK2 [Capsicum annuum]